MADKAVTSLLPCWVILQPFFHADETHTIERQEETERLRVSYPQDKNLHLIWTVNSHFAEVAVDVSHK